MMYMDDNPGPKFVRAFYCTLYNMCSTTYAEIYVVEYLVSK